jgi:membrane protease YdiL (CAAX protease family)
MGNDAPQGERPDMPPVIAHWGWWLHLLVLGAYPLVIGLAGLIEGSERDSVLPSSRGGLFLVAVLEMALFGVVFLIAWIGSRVRADQLYLQWRGGARPVVLGLIYSILLRVAIGIAVALVLAGAMAIAGADRGLLEKARPRIEAVVEAEMLRQDPVYFALTLSLISFVVAGFREELWRAGMLVGLAVLFPRRLSGTKGGIAAAAISAVIFGLGHTTQGWGAVGMVTLLGFGLGAVIVYHRSIWEAVMAHGFFNATSFILLYFMDPKL